MSRENLSSLIELRHYLHSNPELSGKEINTSNTILEYFKSRKPDRIKRIGPTGLLFTYRSKKPKKQVMFRAELDALPITETNKFDYRSVQKGKAHLCGHDGHMAILAGTGDWCSKNLLERTDVHLLFQPAEETGRGAKQVLESPDFDIKPDYVFAIHNIPGFRINTILLKENHFSASVISINIELKGKTSHAAEPENGINPALAVAEIINVFDKFNNNDADHIRFFTSTPIFVRLGNEAYGTSAGQASLGFTFRCWDNGLMKETQASIKNILREIADLNHLKLSYEWVQEFYANYNHSKAVEIIRRSSEKSGHTIQNLKKPFRWGEDFGIFTNRFPGAMIGIGSGTDIPALHNPDYDFPDEIIETGINLYKQLLTHIDKE
jgi:amidohydrolase